MKHIVVFALCLGLAAAGSATAGEMTSGLEMNGGQNAFAGLKLERVQDGTQKEGVLKLQVSMSQTRDLKGYGFVLQFDPAKYEFVEAKEATDNLLNTGSGQPTLFLSASHSPGQVTVGAMKVDGQAVTGEGRLLEVTFKTAEVPLPTDFQIAEGMLVDLEGNIDPVHHLEVGNLKPLPDSFGLDQNMPNPFNPSTTIGYQLPESGQVHLSVYNLLGQVVRTLMDGPLEAGYYTLDWDGRDDLGRQLASGIYLYRMRVNDFSQTRRMMLLK